MRIGHTVGVLLLEQTTTTVCCAVCCPGKAYSRRLKEMESGPQSPVVSGVSPNEGQPGTRLTIRGENLGESLRDIMGVSRFSSSGARETLSYTSLYYYTRRYQDWWSELQGEPGVQQFQEAFLPHS